MHDKTQEEARSVLIFAFMGLTKANRKNLRWHLGNKTRICCGKTYMLYSSAAGGG
jgi:ribosomal protein L10